MELLIVLAIIALIMGVLIVPRLIGSGEEAKKGIAYQKALQIATAQERWGIDHEASCPSSINELVKYMGKNANAKDPWGNEYVMLCGDSAPAEADGFGILSKGKDGRQGTDDDVKSWQKPTK